MIVFSEYMASSFGLEGPLRWEDGELHDLPQDYADMNGWEEIATRVAKIYHDLPEEKRTKCMIYGGSYAHAGAINFYRKKYELPEAYSFSSSYLMWVPEDVDFDNQIMIDDVRQMGESQWFHNMTLVDSIQDPFARDPGLIYYRDQPKTDVRQVWKTLVKEEKVEFGY